MKMPRASPWMSGSTTTAPSMTSDGRMVATSAPRAEKRSVQFDDGMVAEHQPQRPRPAIRPGHLDVAADEAVGETGHVDDAATGQHHRVLELGVDDLAVGGHGAERAHVAVHDAGTQADDRRAEHPAVHDLGAGLDHDPALDGRSGVDRTIDPGLE